LFTEEQKGKEEDKSHRFLSCLFFSFPFVGHAMRLSFLREKFVVKDAKRPTKKSRVETKTKEMKQKKRGSGTLVHSLSLLFSFSPEWMGRRIKQQTDE